MLTIKGFVQIKSLIDNEPGEIATLGELSNYSKTFAPDVGFYNDRDHPDLEIAVFSCYDEDGEKKLPNRYKEKFFEIFSWLHEQVENRQVPSSSAAFVDMVLDEFGASASPEPGAIREVSVGDMVQDDDNNILPQFIRFQLEDDDLERNFIQFWFIDEAFRDQYDEYTIVVVPPIPNVDDLIDEPNIVKQRIDDISLSEWQESIEKAKKNRPPTVVRIESYLWMYPESDDTQDQFLTNWGVIIYGAAGNNIDAVMLALEEQVVEISEYDRQTWREYIPDLFRNTEFMIIPIWDQYSIPNEVTESGLYSPVANLSRVQKIAEYFIGNYDEDHIKNNIQTSVFHYKNITLAIVASPENRDAISTFDRMFDDYIVVPTTSVEYDRMSEFTRDWLDVAHTLVKAAEQMTEFSVTGSGATRLLRKDREDNDLHFAVATYDNVQFLVLSKMSYEHYIDQIDND